MMFYPSVPGAGNIDFSLSGCARRPNPSLDVATILYEGMSSLFDQILLPGLGPVANNPLTLTLSRVSNF